jgi:hypothetical protein
LNNPLRYVDPYGHQQQETWYDRLMKFLGLLWKASGSGDGGMNYESSEQTSKTGGNGPLDIRPEKLAMNSWLQSWLQTGQGLEVLADVEMTLFDPTGAVGGAHDLQQGNYANLGISLAFRAGGPALSKFFGVTTSKLLSGSLLDATVGGSTITAQFSKAGSTLTADIVYIANKSPSGLSGVTRQLYKNVFELAKQQGAENVTVNAVAVTNKKLEQKLLSSGWQRTKVTVEGFGSVDAYTKTFKVPK